jgi:phosphatidylserine/phosphatidylglycerophosphate/cardiolipin synthase-like enzyme
MNAGSSDFEVTGTNDAAPFSLKLHRGDGMVLLGMNWKGGTPPDDFVGFAIEYREPDGNRWYSLRNRLSFGPSTGDVNPNQLSTRLSPIQKFRWVHFPRNAELSGSFTYQVTPVFMDGTDTLSYGDSQVASVELRRETYPGELNVAFTRGFVSSQAFVDRYGADAIPTLLPAVAKEGLDFVPTHPQAEEALAWMGFEARTAILEVLDQAIADADAQVRVIAYDLNEPEVVSRLELLETRLKVIIDDSKDHGYSTSAETEAFGRLSASAGAANVKRQHMLSLQHNKTLVVDGPSLQVVACGSTNFSWRGFFVQNNNAMVLRGRDAVAAFANAFDNYWSQPPSAFGGTDPANWHALGLDGVDVQVAFSPHTKSNALLDSIGKDLETTTSTLFYSLAFLYQTTGAIRDAIAKVSSDASIFVYGISDREVGGLDLQKPDGNVSPVYPSQLEGDVPPPFSKEPAGGGGIRMHHKFAVIDFDRPTARVYLGSYNFSPAADTQNGENFLLVRDRRIAVSYMVEALRIFDHYHFRVRQRAETKARPLVLVRPPMQPGETPWWQEDYTVPQKIRDRELFA